MSGVETAGDGGETQGPRLVAAAPCLEAQRCQESVDHLAHGTLAHASSGGGDVTGGSAGEPQASPQASSPTADEMPQTQPPGSAAVGLECVAARAGEAESGAKAAEGKDGDSKRDYVRWAPEEEETFYLALRGVAGQKPEICLREITNRLTGSKDYAQVRHYYYRLIKRLNKILGEGCTLDIGNPLQVHRSMLKFWDVFAEKGMKGTCMTGIMKKPRKQRELSVTLQRGVKAVMQRTGGAAVPSARGGSNSRKRKPRGSDAAADGAAPVPVEQQEDEEMADAGVAPPPAKQRRRTSGPSTRRQQQLLAAAELSVEAAAGSGAGDVPAEGSSQSHTDRPEACAASDKPASSSHTAGSGPRDGAKKVSTSHSFRSSSNAGLSGPVLEGSQGQVGGRLRLQLQLMPLDLHTAQRMAGAGLHPFLELTLSDSKSLLSVLRHLATKWRQAAPSEVSSASGSGSGLLVHPPADCPMPLRGVCWGGPACDGQLKVSDIHSTLHCPTPFQLLYSWAHPGGAGEAPTQQPGKQAQQQIPPQQQQQQQKPSAAQLAAHLRQAISEVAAGTPHPPIGNCAATASADAWQQQQRQQQQQQAVAGSSQFFLQLLQCDDASYQAMQASPAFTHTSAAAASDELMAVANLAPVCGSGTPDQARPAGSPPAGEECEVAATPSSADPRKPRGLMGLLQSPAVDKPGKPGWKGTPAVKKQPHSQRKPPRSGGAGVRRAGRSGRQQGQGQQQQQQQEQEQQQGGALPAGVGSFLWAHMHPHLQHPHPAEQQPPVSILQQQQQQQQHPVLQQAHCMPFMQQQQQQCQASVPAYHPPQPQQAAGRACMQPGLDFGVSLHRMLGGAAAAADTPHLAAYRSPGSEQHQHHIGAAAQLPASGDFSLKSWPSLSPPSNFQLPDGFDSGISPVCKGGAMMPQLPAAAGTLTGGAKAHPAAAAGALQALLGPTDFSMLLAGIGAAEGSTHQRLQAAGGDGGRAQLTAQAAAGPQQQTRLAVQPPEDSLFGSASLFGMLGTTHQAAAVPADGAALPLLPDKSLAELTFDFGSLMGVGDGTPSWGPPETHLAAQQQAPEGQAPAMGSRHFASLFDRQ